MAVIISVVFPFITVFAFPSHHFRFLDSLGLYRSYDILEPIVFVIN